MSVTMFRLYIQGAVREMATRSFAALVPLLPLARGCAPPRGLSPAQVARSAADGGFLEALLDNSKVEDFVLPFKCNRTLRPYQQEGRNPGSHAREPGIRHPKP